MLEILVLLMPVMVGVLVGISVLISISSRRRAMKRYLYYSAFDPVLSNLGFLFQFSGLLLVPAIVYAYYLQEFREGVAVSIPCTLLLFFGFLLSLLFEPKMLNLKQSCMLLVLYYTFVPLITSIQFLYLGTFEGSFLEQIIDSWFETSSAVSTTGLTLLNNVALPKSVILARAISEWNGGIGIVFILPSSLYLSDSLSQYAKVLGINRITEDFKRSFMLVLLIYFSFTLIFSFILILTGLDVFTAFHTAFDIYSTTGLTIVNVLKLPVAAVITVTVMMLFSAFSFSFNLRFISLFTNFFSSLIKRDWKTFKSYILDWKKLPTKELALYLVILLFFTFIFAYMEGWPLSLAFFHIVDLSSSTGLNLVPFDEMGDTGKILLTVLMMIGPCSFSVGGGIRVLRFYILGKALFASPRILLKGEIPKINLEEDEFGTLDIIINLLVILLFVSASFIVALILINYGYSFVDALVESVSAITTTGDSPKTLTPSLPILPKFLLSILMLTGRIEIIPVFIALSRIKEEKV